MENLSLDELNILIDSLDELEKAIEEVRIKKSNVDPEEVKNYLAEVKALNSKIYDLKCKLEDEQIAKSKS